MLGAAGLAPVLAAHGVETVLPERLTVREQVALFADAALVVAESGAALTNLVFAPSSARIVVLGADRWDLTLFSQLAGHRGQVHRYVAGTPVRGSHPKLYQSRFSLEPAALDAALRDLERTGGEGVRP
jgi:capsular polysaccharide biosynthesis protein